MARRSENQMIELVVCLLKKKQRAAEATVSGLTTLALFSPLS